MPASHVLLRIPPTAPWLPILLASSYWIPSHNKTKSKLRICQNFKFFNYEKSITHDTPSDVTDKMCKYEMDPASIVEDTERTRFCSKTEKWTDLQTERQTDGETDKVKPVYPTSPSLSRAYNNHYSGTLSYQDITFIANNIKQQNYILKQHDLDVEGLMQSITLHYGLSSKGKAWILYMARHCISV